MIKLRFPNKLPTKLVIPLLLVSVIGTAAATMILFTHTFPAVTVAPPPAILASTCTNLVSEGPTPVQGTSGNVTFDCGNGTPAFLSTGVLGIATLTFTLPSGYTSLTVAGNVVGNPAEPSCINPPTIYPNLASGGLFGTGGPGKTGFVYCVSYTNAPAGSLQSFTVSWTQNSP